MEISKKKIIKEKIDIVCPCCYSDKFSKWGEENGYVAVRCNNCALIYVNPRPSDDLINEAVVYGIHSDVGNGKSVVTSRVSSKVDLFYKQFKSLLPDLCTSETPIKWLDVGAGFGELVEGVTKLLPRNSKVVGIEPMKPKAEAAKKRGLDIRNIYLDEVEEKFNIVSIINVFSHIPDFNSFLNEIKDVLYDNGELIIETGNTADLENRSDFSGELDLPDHLVFAGKKQLKIFLERSGFQIVDIQEKRIDNLWYFVKNIIKKLLGRPVILKLPYTSSYRSLLIRAKLVS